MNIDKYLKKLNTYKKKLQNDEDKLSIMNEVYKYVKNITYDFYDGEKLSEEYHEIRKYVLYLEGLIQNYYIIDTNINYDNETDISFFLDYLVYKTREYLLDKYNPFYETINDLNKLDLTNKCADASKHIKDICDNNDIKSHNLHICPGYSYNDKLFNGAKYHFANIIYYNKEYYLVDTTYKQFFEYRANSIERLGVMELTGCNPGIFMLMNKERENIAKELLTKGYIKLDENIIKHYLDGFTISFRNGSFYENTNDYSYTTNYNLKDYRNFLIGFDNQINHEGIENLGFQKSLLKRIK